MCPHEWMDSLGVLYTGVLMPTLCVLWLCGVNSGLYLIRTATRSGFTYRPAYTFFTVNASY